MTNTVPKATYMDLFEAHHTALRRFPQLAIPEGGTAPERVCFDGVYYDHAETVNVLMEQLAAARTERDAARAALDQPEVQGNDDLLTADEQAVIDRAWAIHAAAHPTPALLASVRPKQEGV